MPCYHPLRAFKAGVTKTGKQRLAWDRRGTEGEAVYLPCGKCVGCRLDHARQWSIRCLHESETHEDNCFVTLTYDEAHLPKGGTLVLEHFQEFMRNFRKRIGKVRFFHCGEYGEKNGRPHYHALLFGYDFPDKVKIQEEKGCCLYISEILSSLWCRGFATVGAMTAESAAYVARYSLKKVSAEPGVDRYCGRKPDYVTMSRRPGIGAAWLRRYVGDVYPSDEVVVKGQQWKPPRFYDNMLDKLDPDMLDIVRMQRECERRMYDPYSLANREENKVAALRSYKRRIE